MACLEIPFINKRKYKHKHTLFEKNNKMKKLLKSHPRWDPFDRTEIITRNIIIDGVSYRAQLVKRNNGMILYMLFPGPLPLLNLTGTIFIADTIDTNTQNQFMPTYASSTDVLDFTSLTLIPLLFFPSNTNNLVHLYDINWLWNTNIVSAVDENQKPGCHLFNCWATYGDEDVRFPATYVSLASPNINCRMEVPNGLENITTCHFFLRGFNEQTIQLRVLDMTQLVQENKLWTGTISGCAIMYDSSTNILTATIPQTAAEVRYILNCFQGHIFRDETEIVTIQGSRIAPLELCTRLASTMNDFVSLITEKDESYIHFDRVHGFVYKYGSTVPLPLQSLTRQLTIKFLTRIETIEKIPIEDRTREQWEELELLVRTIKNISERAYIVECSICSNEARLKDRVSGTPFCSKRCAFKINK